MANCHKLFETFNQDISITATKKSALTTSKDGLRERTRKYFKENHPKYEPKFYIQGSFKMKTTIRTKDDTCDLDDGVYFMREPDVEPATLQGWVWDAVNEYTSTAPEHRKKCVRSIFAGDYEIDMPVYHKVDGKEYQLAVKNAGWEDSDPKAMVDWFVGKKDADGKLIKMVKYLKAWCDYKRNKMPNGLAMTILAANAKASIVYNDRDDITLKDTLKQIQTTLKMSFTCKVPAVPYDDLFADYDHARQDRFMTALDDFVADAEKALKEENQLKASRLWKKHLGDRFPDGEDKDEDKSEKNSSYASIIRGAGSSKPWASL